MKKLAVKLAWEPGRTPVVGQLAETDHRIYFEYDPGFMERDLELSPFNLPVRPGLIEHVDRAFGPLPGLFDDSLPDGWGLLLMDRIFRQRGLAPSALSPLDRLAFLGTRTIDQVNAAVGRWPHFADEAGCTKKASRAIGAALRPV
jgi:serine/threonine-protein kinase HipA